MYRTWFEKVTEKVLGFVLYAVFYGLVGVLVLKAIAAVLKFWG